MATVYTEAYERFNGNGVATEFSFSFPYKKREDVKLYIKRNGQIQEPVLSTDFEFITDQSIRFPATSSTLPVLQTGDVLAIQRESLFESDFVFENQRRLEPADVMDADDNMMRLIQENKRDLEKAVKIQPTSGIDSDTFFNEVDRIYESIDSVDIVAGVANEVTTTANNIEAVLDAPNQANIAGENAELSRTWATGTDEEVQAIEEHEHSSRTYSNMAMAIANAPEDVPILESQLLATNVIQGEPWAGGDVTNPLMLVSDDNHPIAIRGMAGASATGYQIIDSNGRGESDFEHYATGDRYGTRITNKNNTSGTTTNIDLYQSNVGRSVLDLSEVQTILAPALLGAMYPVGSIYITTNATCPIADLGVGTWELVAEDRVLQGAGTRGTVGTTINESLPNHYHENFTDEVGMGASITASTSPTRVNNEDGYGAVVMRSGSNLAPTVGKSSNVYGSSTYGNYNTPVQPDAYLINIFRRVQ